VRRGQLAHYGALCRKHQAPRQSRLSDLRRQISYVATLKEPLISIPVCITESTVAASTHLYEMERNLSWIMDKTDKLPRGLDPPPNNSRPGRDPDNRKSGK
jgi:hypothetical protein